MADPGSPDQAKRVQRASTVLGLWGLVVLFGAAWALVLVLFADAPGALSDPRILANIYGGCAIALSAGVAAIGGYFGVRLSRPHLVWFTAVPAIVAIFIIVGAIVVGWT